MKKINLKAHNIGIFFVCPQLVSFCQQKIIELIFSLIHLVFIPLVRKCQQLFHLKFYPFYKKALLLPPNQL